jgi:hypothetical protein
MLLWCPTSCAVTESLCSNPTPLPHALVRSTERHRSLVSIFTSRALLKMALTDAPYSIETVAIDGSFGFMKHDVEVLAIVGKTRFGKGE